jgi:hypothetical protein
MRSIRSTRWGWIWSVWGVVLILWPAVGVPTSASAAPARAAALPSISIGDAGVVEGASGYRAALFNVVLSAPAAGTAQVWFVTASGTAVAGSDYAARSGTITFAGSSISAVIAVRVHGDLTPEAKESFSVNLSGPQGAVLANATGTGTIADDDTGGQGPVAEAGWSALTHVFASPVKIRIPVTLAGPATSGVTLNLRAACVPVKSCTRVPGNVLTLRAGQTERTLTFVVDPTGLSEGRLSVVLTGGTITVGQTTRTSLWRSSTGTSGLVINEVDYDNVGGDTAEFVEVLNTGSTSATLDGLAVVLVNGTTGAEYRRVALTGSLPANGYLVVADSAVTVPSGARVVRFSATHDNIQNGAPDGVALVDTVGLKVLDAVSYEGSVTQAHITGFSAPVTLVEGTPTTAADSNTTQGALARIPNGTDTNDAHHDWALVPTPTPGAANHT